MTSRRKSVSIRLDEALREWPSVERTAMEWDESAEAVLSGIHGGKAWGGAAAEGVSDEALVVAPLPEGRGDLQGSAPLATAVASAGGAAAGAAREMNDTSSTSRQRDRASLKELAKLAETAPPSSQPMSDGARSSRPSFPGSGKFEATDAKPASVEREENSGIIHLASLTAEAAAAASSAPPAPSAPVSSVRPDVVPQKQHPAAASAPRSSSRSLFTIGSLVAAAAVAAGVFVGMKHQGGGGPSMPVAASPAPVQADPAAPSPAVKAVGTPIAAADKGVDPMSLPAVDTSAPGRVAPSGPRPANPANPMAAPAVAVASSAPPAANAPPDPKLLAVVPTSTAAPDDGKSLTALMQQAAGVTPSTTSTPPSTPDAPQAAAGSVSLKPSLGAIQGALGAAMPGARACLGPDDPVSRAMVTFQSDGSVQSVSVSGGAAGKPAEACIRSALMRARVAPFAQPTFSAPATIRGS